MSLKRRILEGLVFLAAHVKGRTSWCRQSPERILVLRNNDIGDLLVITPVFEALKKSFPRAEIIAGIGSWNLPILENNPFVDTVLKLNAPWHNKQSTKAPHNSVYGFYRSLKYIYTSEEAKTLKNIRCDTGIDILGSPEGALLMLKADIRNRIGVCGYAGGHSGCQKNITFNAKYHVSKAALDQVQLLTKSKTINVPQRPQIYLSDAETSWAEATWAHHKKAKEGKALRILIGAGAGLIEKCWPSDYFGRLTRAINEFRPATFLAVGTDSDAQVTQTIKKHTPSVSDMCGLTTLRQTFALCSTADLILCNSSMLMHAGAAFNTRTMVFLGPEFKSAKAHDFTWGYPQTCTILGAEPHAPQLTTPEEALKALRQKLWI